jgi:hypothetical protein
MDMYDQTFTVKGRVTAMREEGGTKLVDLEIWTENAQGKSTTPGTATVVLDA